MGRTKGPPKAPMHRTTIYIPGWLHDMAREGHPPINLSALMTRALRTELHVDDDPRERLLKLRQEVLFIEKQLDHMTVERWELERLKTQAGWRFTPKAMSPSFEGWWKSDPVRRDFPTVAHLPALEVWAILKDLPRKEKHE